MSTAYRRKLIEVDLPLDVINAESAREKSIRHGHPSTLHLWWARRPLAACRAVIFGSLVDDPVDCPDEFPTEETQRAERERLHELIRRLVVWENSSDANLLAEARYEIARSVARFHGETAPTAPDAVLDYLNRQAKPIYDPFCGGGSIPLEVQRLGLRAVGSDLNPVAVLITKALIELPPKFANRPPVNPDADPMGLTVGKGKRAQQVPWRGAAGLADDVRYYGRKMREMAWERIGHLYPTAKLPDGGEATVIAWLWARTVPCPNPACGVAMPLLTTFQASKKRGNEHWMWPVIDREAKTVGFTVRNRKPPPEVVAVERTVTRNGATCVACGGAVNLEYVRQQARAGAMSEVMTCVVAEGDRKRLFLSPSSNHIGTPLNASPGWRPNSRIPEHALGFSVQGYGFTEWGQLFSERQLTALTTFSDLLGDIRKTVIKDGADDEYVSVLRTYLALAVGRLTNSCSSFARWQNSGDKVAGVFAMPTLPMLWDFVESNPFCAATQNWMAQIEWVAEVPERLPTEVNPGVSIQSDAANIAYEEQGPIIVTDPPYYANIGYADLSDYFYTWLRPLLRDIYPNLFASILVPKDAEMIAGPRFENARDRFEHLLITTLREIRQRCSPEFPSSIFYAYKQQEEERDGRASTGWETMLTALVKSRFQIVGTWPMRTERPGRSRQIGSNALASSVVLVCRPRPDDATTASRGDFMDALARELPPALAQLTREGHIAPVDLRQAAIGPGMAVYSRYASVTTLAGEPVTVRQALVAINDAVADFLEQQAGQLDAESRFCLDWLRTHPGGQGNYGLAEDLARAYNLSIDDRLAREHRLLTAGQGQVALLGIDDYDEARSYPQTGADVTAWEACHRMAWHMQPGEEGRGVQGCVAVAQRAGDRLDDVERLARTLYDVYDRRNDSRRAVAFNSVVTAWPNIVGSATDPAQQELRL
jgi:putative DNA methylase